MSDAPSGPGWWQASDGKWYAPEQHPDYRPPLLPPPPPPSVPQVPQLPPDFPEPQPLIPPGPVIEPDTTSSGPIVQSTRRWLPWLLVAVGALAAVGVVAAVVGGDDDDPPADVEAVASVVPDEPVASTLAPSSQLPSASSDPPSEVPPPSEPMCEYLGVDDFGDMQLDVSFSNMLGEVGALEVTYAVIGEGVRVAAGSDFVEYPAADERFRIHVDTLTEPPAGADDTQFTCEIRSVGEIDPFSDLTRAAEPTTCEYVETDEFGDIQLDITTTSPFDTTADLEIMYALRSSDGTRFSQATTFSDVVEPGETIQFAEDTLTGEPEWLDDGVILCDVLGIEQL